MGRFQGCCGCILSVVPQSNSYIARFNLGIYEVGPNSTAIENLEPFSQYIQSARPPPAVFQDRMDCFPFPRITLLYQRLQVRLDGHFCAVHAGADMLRSVCPSYLCLRHHTQVYSKWLSVFAKLSSSLCATVTLAGVLGADDHDDHRLRRPRAAARGARHALVTCAPPVPTLRIKL